MKDIHKTYISRKNIKLLALKGNHHKEIEYDYGLMQDLHEDSWHIYATNDNGVWFFLNNCEMDGADWCKISKQTSL